MTGWRPFSRQVTASAACFQASWIAEKQKPSVRNPRHMKKLFTLMTVAAFAFASGAMAAEKKAPAEKPADAAKKAVEKPAEAVKEAAAEAKPMPMHSRADVIDTAAKTFTNKRKDGVEVKHVVTDKTEIKNGEAAAKFEDIKAGDYVNGLRLKKSETEYEVVKITKIGPAPEKKDAAEGDKKPEAKPADKKVEEKPADKKPK